MQQIDVPRSLSFFSLLEVEQLVRAIVQRLGDYERSYPRQ